MPSQPDNLVSRVRAILNEPRYKYPGLLAGLVAAAGFGAVAAGAAGVALPAAAIVGVATAVSNLLTNLGAAELFQLTDDSKPLPDPEVINPVLDKQEVQRKIQQAVLKIEFDNQIAKAFGQLPPDLGEKAWEKYCEYIDERKDALADLAANVANTRRLITQRRFTVIQVPSQLHGLFDDWLPGNLIHRPEYGPIIEHLQNRRVHKLALLGRPLSGKTVLAAQIAANWLSTPGRTVGILRSKPLVSDKESLADLDPENDLFICDVDYFQAEPLTPEDIDIFTHLPCRVIFCQRIGQPTFGLQEAQLKDYLRKGGSCGYQHWNAVSDAPPATGRAVVALGPITPQNTSELISGTIRTLFPTSRLTLTDEAREVFHQGMQVFSHDDPECLVGLVRAFLTYSHHKYGAGAGISGEEAVRILAEVGLDRSRTSDPNLDDVLKKCFIDILDIRQRDALRVMARWQLFSRSPAVPAPALNAGYLELYKKQGLDLRIDYTPMENLLSSRVVTLDKAADIYHVWHGKQLELIPDDFTWAEKKAWLTSSLNALKELVAAPEFHGLLPSIHLADFCAHIVYADHIEDSLRTILERVYEQHLENARQAQVDANKDQQEKETALALLSLTINNLGWLYQRLYNQKAAKSIFQTGKSVFTEHAFRLGEANCLQRLGDLKRREDDLDGARLDYEAALPIFRDIRDRLGEANCLQSLGDLKTREDDLDGARLDYEAALPIYRDIRERMGEANCLRSLGDLKMREDDLDGARLDYEAALPIFRDIRERMGEANCLRSLGDLKMREDDLDGARLDYEAALPIFRDIRERMGEANCLRRLGDLKRREDDLDGARLDYEAALPIFRDIRARLGEANCLQSLGDLKMRESDLEGARLDYEAALPIFRDIRERMGEANCLQRLGDLKRREDDLEGARLDYEAALPIFRDIRDRLGEANCLRRLGDLKRREDDLEGARLDYEAALPIFRDIRARLGEANCLKSLGDLKMREDDLEGARLDCEAALPIFRDIRARLGEANCLQSIGLLRLALGDYAGAFTELVTIIEIYQETRDSLGLQSTFGYMSQTAFTASSLDQALLLAEKSLEIGRAINDRFGQTITLEMQGEIWVEAEERLPENAAKVLLRELYIQIGQLDQAAQLDEILEQVKQAMGDEKFAEFTQTAEDIRRQFIAQAAERFRQTGRDILDPPPPPEA